MGEMAEAILDGDFCQVCGVFLGDGMGFPRTCLDCQEDENEGDVDFPEVEE